VLTITKRRWNSSSRPKDYSLGSWTITRSQIKFNSSTSRPFMFIFIASRARVAQSSNHSPPLHRGEHCRFATVFRPPHSQWRLPVVLEHFLAIGRYATNKCTRSDLPATTANCNHVFSSYPRLFPFLLYEERCRTLGFSCCTSSPAWAIAQRWSN
jgi:hypothetical protein